MLKKVLVWLLVLSAMVSLLPLGASALTGASMMYVNTSNGKPLNVREKPSKEAKIIGKAIHGDSILVDWSYAGNDGWSRVVWGSMGDGYVMTRYLSSTKPKTKPVPQATEDPQVKATAKTLNALVNEYKTGKQVSSPYPVYARASRASGWVNVFWAPSTEAKKITTVPDGQELTVIAATKHWYQVKLELNGVGYVGYVSQKFAEKRAQ